MEILIPSDAEVPALTELSSLLPSHGFPGLTTAAGRVGTKLPTVNPKPAEFVRLFTSGGAPRDLVTDTPTLVVEGYAKKEQRARDLCAVALAILERAGRMGDLGGAVCYEARTVSLPANLPYPQLPDYFRFTAMISVSLRRATV